MQLKQWNRPRNDTYNNCREKVITAVLIHVVSHTVPLLQLHAVEAEHRGCFEGLRRGGRDSLHSSDETIRPRATDSQTYTPDRQTDRQTDMSRQTRCVARAVRDCEHASLIIQGDCTHVLRALAKLGVYSSRSFECYTLTLCNALTRGAQAAAAERGFAMPTPVAPTVSLDESELGGSTAQWRRRRLTGRKGVQLAATRALAVMVSHPAPATSPGSRARGGLLLAAGCEPETLANPLTSYISEVLGFWDLRASEALTHDEEKFRGFQTGDQK
eukprot:510941-Prorocentrum_minimum.AAC.1